MLILGLDFETSGLNPKEDRVVEVGLCLWDTNRRRPVKQWDFFVQPDIHIPSEKWAEVTPIHGVTQQDLDKYGVPDHEAIVEIRERAWQADAIVAHNGTMFDKLFLDEWCLRYDKKPFGLWIDTRLDLPEPLTGQLICIAAKHGFLNPFPHQALSDVLTMLRILDSYNLNMVLERAKIPNITVQAIVSFDDRDRAKERGYYWQPYPLKQWRKAIKECDLKKEQSEAPFKVRQV